MAKGMNIAASAERESLPFGCKPFSRDAHRWLRLHKPRLSCEMELEACHSDIGRNKTGWNNVLINMAIEEISVFIYFL